MQLNLDLKQEIEVPIILLNSDKKPVELNVLPDDYTLLDIETTGLSPLNDSIIEISSIKVRNNKVVSEFSSLVNPNRKLPPFISSLTGITDSELMKARSIKSALFDFCNFLQDDVTIGHIVSFDLSFINKNLITCFGASLKNDYADTLYFSRKKYPNLKSHKLTSLAQHFNIDTKNAHRALADCYMTFNLINNIKG